MTTTHAVPATATGSDRLGWTVHDWTALTATGFPTRHEYRSRAEATAAHPGVVFQVVKPRSYRPLTPGGYTPTFWGTVSPMPPTKRQQTAPAPAATPAVPETPLEETNPPGAPEGTEPTTTGTVAEGHDTPTGPADAVQPQGSDLHPDNSTEDGDSPLETGPRTTTAQQAVDDLERYLRTHHAREYVQGAVADQREHPATTALRLLQRLGAAGTQVTRCTAPYCNLPAGHTDAHGWVHVEPGTARG